MQRGRIGAVLVCLLLLCGGGAVAQAAPRAALTGALNILIVGIDPRDTRTAPLADAIMVVHLPADRRRGYLFSIPRDLVVRIPAFAPSGTGAQRTKINAAMALGSRTGPRRYSAAQGYRLLARTVGQVTGIRRFDAGAVLGFGGFRAAVDALGGVKMVIDQDVVSEHRKPDGSPRDRRPECRVNQDCPRPYIGAQKVYRKSDRPVRLQAWEALDYVRQRYGLPRGDYDRQRHQRQFLEAAAKRATSSTARLLTVAAAAGDSLTFDGGGHTVLDWAREVRGLRDADLTTVGLPGEAVFEGGQYRGERLTGPAGAFFAAVAADRAEPFLRRHPGLADAPAR